MISIIGTHHKNNKENNDNKLHTTLLSRHPHHHKNQHRGQMVNAGLTCSGPTTTSTRLKLVLATTTLRSTVNHHCDQPEDSCSRGIQGCACETLGRDWRIPVCVLSCRRKLDGSNKHVLWRELVLSSWDDVCRSCSCHLGPSSQASCNPEVGEVSLDQRKLSEEYHIRHRNN